jgi:hypothetical protein
MDYKGILALRQALQKHRNYAQYYPTKETDFLLSMTYLLINWY